jgi:hypothetical protein
VIATLPGLVRRQAIIGQGLIHLGEPRSPMSAGRGILLIPESTSYQQGGFFLPTVLAYDGFGPSAWTGGRHKSQAVRGALFSRFLFLG